MGCDRRDLLGRLCCSSTGVTCRAVPVPASISLYRTENYCNESITTAAQRHSQYVYPSSGRDLTALGIHSSRAGQDRHTFRTDKDIFSRLPEDVWIRNG